MTVLAAAVYLAKRDRDALMAQVNTLTDRVIALEKRRTIQVAEPARLMPRRRRQFCGRGTKMPRLLVEHSASAGTT
jgi:hypothetical protein